MQFEQSARHQMRKEIKQRVVQRVSPNPSIEATNTGGQRSRAFAEAVPPVFAPHLQR
jgi:hypothetical protein